MEGLASPSLAGRRGPGEPFGRFPGRSFDSFPIAGKGMPPRRGAAPAGAEALPALHLSELLIVKLPQSSRFAG